MTHVVRQTHLYIVNATVGKWIELDLSQNKETGPVSGIWTRDSSTGSASPTLNSTVQSDMHIKGHELPTLLGVWKDVGGGGL